jgi:hypothetical protein
MRLFVKHSAIRTNFYNYRVSETNEPRIRNTTFGVGVSNSKEIHDTHFSSFIMLARYVTMPSLKALKSTWCQTSEIKKEITKRENKTVSNCGSLTQ